MIRIKVGVLAVIIAIFALGGWIGYMSLPTMLYSAGQYDALLKWFPNDDQASYALFQKAGEITQSSYEWEDGRIFISNSWRSTSGNYSSTSEQRQEARLKLEQLISDYPASPYSNTLRFNVAKLFMWDQEWDKAEEMFKIIERNVDAFPMKEDLYNFLAILESRHVDPEVTPSIKGNVTIGDKPAANVYVVLQRSNDNGWHTYPYGQYPMTLTDEKGNYQFSGIEPAEYNVSVGVRPEQVAGYYLTENAIKTVKISHDKTGAYDFRFIPQVRTTYPVNHETIEGDELRFEWEPYEGADYYEVYLTSMLTSENGKDKSTTSFSTTITEDKHRDVRAVYSIKELRNTFYEGPKNVDLKGNVTFWPSSVLGKVYPGGKFIWYVEAFSAEGRKLSSSAGYYLDMNSIKPLFNLSEEHMLEGDRLVIKHKYAEAMEAYKRDGDNEYALRALARLTANGIEAEGEGNPAEAIAYLERIKEPTEQDEAYKLNLEEQVEMSKQ